MKKSLKKIIVSSLCLILGGGIFVSNALKTEKISVNSVKYAEGYTVASGTCVKTIEELKVYHKEIYNKDLKPLLTYVYNGQQAKTSEEEVYYCDNPNTLIGHSINVCEDKEYYYDAALTEPIPEGATTMHDVLKGNGGIEILKTDSNGCITSYDYITTLYIKCKETTNCDTNYSKTYKIHYVIDGKEASADNATVGTDEQLLTPKKDGYTFDGWYLDAKYVTKVNGTTTKALTANAVKNASNCITGYNDITLYAKFTSGTTTSTTDNTPTISKDDTTVTPSKDDDPSNNPETGDNLYIYIALGAVIIIAGGITIKKLTNK